ncbi:MAG: RNA methyltransferase [Oscillospiraceae bacterium]|nr:RNA methyltransferase [Oscillospiraceae bacterium]
MEQVTSRANERVKQIVSLKNEPALRREAGLCVLEGFKLCGEALRLGLSIEELWISEAALEKNKKEAEGLIASSKSAVLMSEGVCEKLTEQKSPQGALALVSLPAPLENAELGKFKKAAALCSVQDPANVGAAARCAAAFGYALVLTADCADLFSPKALRASMGAALRLPFAVFPGEREMLAALQSAGFETLAAAMTEDAEPLGDFEAPERFALLIGSEGRGLPEDIISACSRRVAIPVSAAVESLNASAAAAVLMWELGK